MKITLNLATRPYADLGPAIKQLRIGMAVLAVILLALVFGLFHFHQSALKMAAQEAALDQAVAKIRREQQGYEAQMRLPDNAKVLTQATFLNRLFDEKSFSWTAAMEDLEPVLPTGVQVTSLEPNRAKDGTLTLHLRVSGLRERAVDLVRNMEQSKRFVSPRITGENSENAQSQGNIQPAGAPGRVAFDVLAEYNPATLEERKTFLASKKRTEPTATLLPHPASGPRPGYQPPVNLARPGIMNRSPNQPGGQPGSFPAVPPGVRPRVPLNPAANPNPFQNRIQRMNQVNPPVPQPTQQPNNGGPQ